LSFLFPVRVTGALAPTHPAFPGLASAHRGPHVDSRCRASRNCRDLRDLRGPALVRITKSRHELPAARRACSKRRRLMRGVPETKRPRPPEADGADVPAKGVATRR